MDQHPGLLLMPPQDQPRPEPTRMRRIAVMALLVAIAVLLVFVLAQMQPTPKGRTWIVAPTGTADASGLDQVHPLSLQGALDQAQPGDVIELQSGVYRTDAPLRTKRDGTARAPITIKGPEEGLDIAGRNKAVVTGTGHVFDVDNSYYVFEGFTIDGQPDVPFGDIPGTPQELLAFKDANQPRLVDSRLIYIGNKADHITGIVINDMFLTGSGGECVRMRNLTTDSKVTDSLIYRCGLVGNEDKDYTYHNGEGVYIGTSLNSENQPHYKDDASSGNLVRNNVIETFGSECVDIKENAAKNIVDSNQCRHGLGSADDNESILEVRGKDNQVTNNTIAHSYGYGIKVWADKPRYGGGNIVAGNHLRDIRSDAITVKEQQLRAVCGNTFDGTPTFAGLEDGADPTARCQRRYPAGAVVPAD